ncbi:MAG: hypothetical protein C5B43_04000 [Verrucomicrobia bacterium]|nr:MAG: hypothetical protein C5B43_04000 [Verrucomicrobiota bacterium]
MKWIFVFLVLIGDYLIIKKNKVGFIIWLIVDGGLSISSFYESRLEEGVVFFIYAAMGVYGLKKW